jgi:hypothetical protein
MTEQTADQLVCLIEFFINANPVLNSKPNYQYLAELTKDFIVIKDEVILQSITLCIDKRYFETKHISYFRAIVLSKQQELLRRTEVEKRTLGDIPEIKI